MPSQGALCSLKELGYVPSTKHQLRRGHGAFFPPSGYWQPSSPIYRASREETQPVTCPGEAGPLFSGALLFPCCGLALRAHYGGRHPTPTAAPQASSSQRN
ncbi:hypothetical protein VULLAG_LOCUS15998 [Vulpes lagopus]